MNTILFSVGVIGNVLSFLVFLAPIKTFWRVVKIQSTEEFEPAPYVVTLLGSLLWVYYGVTKPGEYLVATVNGVGIILEAIYVLLFLVYASPAVRARTAILVAILDVGFFGGVVLVTQLGIDKELQVSVTGVICACLNIFMYASPLAVMKTVISTKSVEYMPFLLSFFLFLNGGVWALYAILDKNIFLGEKGKKKIMPEVVRRSGRLLKADATTILEKADKRAAIKSLEITDSTHDGGPKGIAGLLAIKNKELLVTQMQGISEDETEQREIVVTNTERAIAGREYVINSQGRDSSHMEIGEGPF